MVRVPEISRALKIGRIQLMCVEYGYNEKFINNPERKIPIEFSLTPKVKRFKKEKKAIVSLELKLFKKNVKDFPIWAKIKNQAEFEWDIDDKIAETLLETAAPAHLLSYIRPLLSQLTTMSDLPALIIPLINFKSKKEDSTI